MTSSEKLIENLEGEIFKEFGRVCTYSEEMIIDRIAIYNDIFNEAYNHVKGEGYRKPVADISAGITPPRNARYALNIAFPTMNDCARQIRSDIELLGLSKKGKRIEIISKVERVMTKLDKINDIPD